MKDSVGCVRFYGKVSGKYTKKLYNVLKYTLHYMYHSSVVFDY